MTTRVPLRARGAVFVLSIAAACAESAPSPATTSAPAPRPVVAAAHASTATDVATPTTASPPPSAGAQEVATELVALRRAVVQGLVTDDDAFVARFIPFVANGVPDGVRLHGIRLGSGLAQLGFMNGDQVRTVGDEPVTDLGALRALPARLLAEPDIEVATVRRGVALVLRYRVTD